MLVTFLTLFLISVCKKNRERKREMEEVHSRQRIAGLAG